MWLAAFVTTCLYRHFCDQPTLGVQQWGHLHSEFCHADVLLRYHLAFSEKPQCWGEEKSPLHVHLPYHPILFFVPCMFIYTHLATTFPMDKMITVFYTFGTSLLNPLIYTLRNAEVKNAMRMLWSKNLYCVVNIILSGGIGISFP